MISLKEFYTSMGFEYRDAHPTNSYEAMILSGGFCIKIERVNISELKVTMIADGDLHKRVENISSRAESSFNIKKNDDTPYLTIKELDGEWFHTTIVKNIQYWGLMTRCYNIACRDSKLELIGI